MTTANLQEQARALGDPTRHAIFRHIAAAGGAVGVAEINEHFELNHNAIRQHLAKLVAAGLVVETSARANGPGRPRLVYEVNPAVEGQWGTAGPYERLSRLLVEIIRTGLDAEEVGRRAADQFRVPSPSGDAVADISAAMARQGFEPEVRAAGDGAEIVLHRCPFATSAIADRATVCALHLGIAEGLAAGTAATVEELVANDPRKADCRLRIRVTTEPAEPPGTSTLSLRGRAPRA
ncbi:MAG TPA: helix-turn-helix domain-containing protein [Acidimicrobiales bacterium]|nr:helix-turn-helix domain-containing protein [Acidimicrobiales bacterium]